MAEKAVFFGNGPALHDSVVGKKGDFEKTLALFESGADPAIAVTRKNAFFIDKILLFLAGQSGADLDLKPFSPSPVSDIHRRFTRYMDQLEAHSKKLNIKIEFPDEKLLLLFEKVEQLCATHPETTLLRLLGIVCETALVGPHWFVFETINACNSNCRYCNIHSPSREPADNFLRDRLDFSVFKSIADDLEDMGIDGVTILANGEPLMHPNFADMAVYAKGKGFLVNFFSNGLLLDRRISQTIVKAGVDEAFITISAATEKTYLELHSRQKPGDFQMVLDNLGALGDIKKNHDAESPVVTGVHVICAPNYTEIMGMAKQAHSLGISKLRLALIRLDEHNRQLALTRDDVDHLRKQLPELEAYCDEKGIQLWEGYRFQLEHADDPENWSGDAFIDRGCLMGWGLGLVKANAYLSFCCVVKPIVNLKQGAHFRDVWQSGFYQTVRVAAKNFSRPNDVRFTNGEPLLTDACRHCDNHDINASLHNQLSLTGLDKFLD